MCYTRASNYWQATGRTEPDHPDHYTDFGRLLCSLTIANCATLARRELIARYYDEVRPAEHPGWKTDDAPMWLWFSVRSRISYLPDITAVHRRLPDSVSHSTAYRKRIAFCDSLMDISLWFDARYGGGTPHSPAAQFARMRMGIYGKVRVRGISCRWLAPSGAASSVRRREGTAGEKFFFDVKNSIWTRSKQRYDFWGTDR